MNKKANLWILAIVGVVAVVALVVMFQGSGSATGYAPNIPLSRGVIKPTIVVGANAKGEAVILATKIANYLREKPNVDITVDNIKLDTDVKIKDLILPRKFNVVIMGDGEKVIFIIDERDRYQQFLAINVSKYIQSSLNTASPYPHSGVVGYQHVSLHDLNINAPYTNWKCP